MTAGSPKDWKIDVKYAVARGFLLLLYIFVFLVLALLIIGLRDVGATATATPWVTMIPPNPYHYTFIPVSARLQPLATPTPAPTMCPGWPECDPTPTPIVIWIGPTATP